MNKNGLSNDRNDPCWLVVGAGGGIGQALVEVILQREPQSRVICTHRTDVVPVDRRTRWYPLDFRSAGGVEHCAPQIAAEVERIDYFVCCSGWLSDVSLGPEKRLDQLDEDHLQRSYQINAAGPLLMFSAVARQLKQSPRGVAAFLSAQVGSIEDNGTGGWYSYRMAKAALNMGIKSAAIEVGRWHRPPVVMAVHPGTTATQLSRPFTRNRTLKSAATTAQQLYELMINASATQHGQFLTADGRELPW